MNIGKLSINNERLRSAFYVPASIPMADSCRKISVGEGDLPLVKVQLRLRKPSPSVASDCGDETEDEEVKMNCAGGIPEYISSDDSDSDEDDDSVATACSEGSSRDGIVHFVSHNVVQHSQLLQRPRPVNCTWSAYWNPAEAHSGERQDSCDDGSSVGDSQSRSSTVFTQSKLVENQLLDCVGLDNSFSQAVANGYDSDVFASPSTASTAEIEDDDWSRSSIQTDDPQVYETAKRCLSSEDLLSIASIRQYKRLRTSDDCVDAGLEPILKLRPLTTSCDGSLTEERASITACVSELGDDTEEHVPPASPGDVLKLDVEGQEPTHKDICFGPGSESPPIALLTPPRSPICIQPDADMLADEETALDTALTTALLMNPPSPLHQERLGYEHEDRLLDYLEQRYSPPSVLAPMMS
mmetsp:Transcript_357/g.614  ORF Transcript_357/g.614 Transcript_357/m.614 type:complete len:412 (-) Transcript_357:271-1506(-)